MHPGSTDGSNAALNAGSRPGSPTRPNTGWSPGQIVGRNDGWNPVSNPNSTDGSTAGSNLGIGAAARNQMMHGWIAEMADVPPNRAFPDERTISYRHSARTLAISAVPGSYTGFAVWFFVEKALKRKGARRSRRQRLCRHGLLGAYRCPAPSPSPFFQAEGMAPSASIAPLTA